MTEVRTTTAKGRHPGGRNSVARAVGKWIAGIVAAVLGSVLAYVVINKLYDERQIPYQKEVVNICTEDRENELKFKHQLDQLSQDLVLGDTSTMYTIPKLMTDTIIEEQGLANGLEGLHPPTDQEPVQSEAVSTWRRKLDASRDIRDQIVKLAADFAGDPSGFAQALKDLNYKEESRLENEKDSLLGRLGGPDCKPSP